MPQHETIFSENLQDSKHALEDDSDIGLIVLDDYLPYGLGSDLLQQLTHDGNTTKVIVTSANTDTDFIAIGADEFISKPYRVNHLKQLVDKYSQDINT